MIEQYDLEEIFEEFLKPIPAAVMARTVYEMILETCDQLDVSSLQTVKWLEQALPEIITKVEGNRKNVDRC